MKCCGSETRIQNGIASLDDIVHTNADAFRDATLSSDDKNKISIVNFHFSEFLERGDIKWKDIPDLIGFHFAFEGGKKRAGTGEWGPMPPCKSSPWTVAYKYSTICIFPRRGSGTGHFQDGCRHFARYTPKVLLPTKFQLAFP